MTTTVFLDRIETYLIDNGYMNRLDDFDWHKRATGCFNFLVGPRRNLLSVARTAFAEANMVDK